MTSPETVRAYFDAAPAWSLDRENGRRSIWVHTSGRRVLVPALVGPDTGEVLRIAIADVAAAELRDPSDVEIDFTWHTFDRLHVRREAEGSALPFETAIDLHGALRDLIASAARSASEPKRFFSGGRRPAEVNDYLDSVRLIPSLPGSFVVRALLPLTTGPGGDQLPLAGPAAPAVRRISVQIIGAAQRAVETASDVASGAPLSRWDEAVNVGVSSNLCDALARLPGESDRGPVELRAVWTWAAPDEPLPPVVVHPGQVAPLAAAADYLRDQDEVHTIHITGLVTKLHRETAGGPGEATVKGYIDGWDASQRSLRINLGQEDYRRVIAAHDDGNSVRVSAVVRRSPSGLSVERVEDLQILKD